MEIITLEASLENPGDPTEVNLVAAVAGVGNTDRLSSGQIIRWTADILRSKASTMVGKPVNILLNAAGDATQHSRKAIGTIKEAWFDEDKQSLMVKAALWGHYFSNTITKIRELFAQNKLNVSMEFMYSQDSLIANDDGSHTPTTGQFSGMGIVGKAGDPRSQVYLMAALKDDQKQENSVTNFYKKLAELFTGAAAQEEAIAPAGPTQEELEAAHEGSFQWLMRGLAQHLTAGKVGEDAVMPSIIATFPNHAIYQEGDSYFRLPYQRDGGKLKFGEPQEVDPVYQPTAKASVEENGSEPVDNTGNSQGEQDTMTATPEELLAAKDAKIEEIKTSLDAALSTITEMKAAQDQRTADEKADKLGAERIAELSKILPEMAEDKKVALQTSLRTLEQAAYEVVKASLASAAELRAGIAPGDTINNPDQPGQKDDGKSVSDEDMKLFRAEASARFGTGDKSDEDKE